MSCGADFLCAGIGYHDSTLPEERTWLSLQEEDCSLPTRQQVELSVKYCNTLAR